MGWWARQVVPRLVAGGGDEPTVLALRARACDGLEGRVVELGFGSGSNLRVLPAAVTEVVAVEPSDVAWRLSQSARDASPVPVTRGGLDAGRLDLPDGSADAVLSTLTLCTVPDAAAALAEVRRVLRPGGALHLLEHGLSPDAPVRRWQHRLDPLQRRLFDGCHLTRPVDELVAGSGLTVEAMGREYGPFPRPLRPWGYLYVGRARRY